MRNSAQRTSRISTEASANTWSGAVASWLRKQWARHGRTLLLIAAAYMVFAAIGHLAYAFPYLVSDVASWAAIDLKHRYTEVQRWFTGLPVYGAMENGDYPPASYAMLWPLLGWLPLPAARWLLAIITAIALAVLAYLLVRESTASTRLQCLFMALLPFSIYPTQMNVFGGQLGVHVLFLLVAGLVWLRWGQGRWWEDLIVSVLFVLSLVKPTLSAPFFWIVLLVPGRLRPAVLVVLGYSALTLLAASFQKADLLTLLQTWIGQTGSQVSVLEGHANMHKWLALVGLEAWMLPVSLLILALLGGWTWRHRKGDFWILLGVAALVARLWVHHRPHDDLLLLIPMVTLFQLAERGPAPGGSDVIAGALLALTWAGMHTPTWAFYDLPRSFVVWIGIGQTMLWLAVLVFLLKQPRRRARIKQADGTQGINKR